jgi:putative nucleotidyltransferase with HDIG domain
MPYTILPERGRVFVGGTVAIGSAVIALSALEVWSESFGPRWLVLAALTLLSGSATVKLPSVPATISISETFVFTSVLLFGPAAGATIVALDGLIISSWFARRRKELYRVLFNMAAPALSIWLSAHVYFLFPGVRPLVSNATITIDKLIVPLLVFALLHFIVNSTLIAVAVAFETGRGVWNIWRKDFLWLSLNYFGGASVSALLVVYTREIDPAYLSVIVPLLLILYFTFKIPMARVEDTNRHLTKVNSLYLSTIETLALAIDAKDQVTHGHIRRVQTFAVELAKAIGILDHDQLKAIEASALLHDMGKLAVPEHILNKPGKLTSAEFEKMKLHASIGADILSSIEFPYPVVPIVRHHHENWNGSGYPAGICGIDIPIGARILSVVDCFDALTSDRPYRPRLNIEEATKILLDRRGTMYDPLVVDTFIQLQPTLLNSETSSDRVVTASSQHSAPAQQLTPVNETRANGATELQLFRLYELLTETADKPWEDIADLFVYRLSRIIPFDVSLIYVYDRAEDDLVCESTYGAGMSPLKGRRISLGSGLTGWVAAHRKAQLNSPGALDAHDSSTQKLGELSSALVVPVLNREALVGVISLYRHSVEGFSSRHLELLTGLARHVGPVLKRRRSVGANGSAIEPYLTAMHLDKYLRSLRIDGARSVCLILVKFETDRASTETVLKDLQKIYELLREGDLVFVCDQSTFVCLLADTNDDSAAAVEARLTLALGRRRVSVARLDLPAGPSASLAAIVSVGPRTATNQLS